MAEKVEYLNFLDVCKVLFCLRKIISEIIFFCTVYKTEEDKLPFLSSNYEDYEDKNNS